MKKLKFLLVLILLVIPVMVLAEPPEKPPGDNGGSGGPGGQPGGGSSSASYVGATTISSDTNLTSQTYTSSTGSENALLVSGGTSTLNTCTITKTGDSSGDDSDFYGTNAAVLVYNGATLNITGGNITTNGSHANAVFAYGTGIINISDTTIKTTSNNSGAIMVTGGGTLTANNVTAETDGNSSAPIRSDRGGGTLTVNKGTYTSNGMGSPAIYSTANIIVNDAKLVSTSSEGVVVEGKNSVTLNNATLEATNTTLNGNSETYKGIFIYQSMSGDAEVGTSSFTSKDSTITNNKGDVIFVTNTNTVIELENNIITNNDKEGSFLRIQAGKWGNTGSNGGTVSLKMINQDVEGNIVVDSISTLALSLEGKSELISAINNSNEAKEVNLTISKTSVLSLTGDTYLTSLTNEDSTNSNIYSNGKYKLYVNGEEITINSDTYSSKTEPDSDAKTEDEPVKKDSNNNLIYYIIGGSALLVILVIAIIIIVKKKGKKNAETNI